MLFHKYHAYAVNKGPVGFIFYTQLSLKAVKEKIQEEFPQYVEVEYAGIINRESAGGYTDGWQAYRFDEQYGGFEQIWIKLKVY